MIDTPIFQLRRELLMRNFEKVSQLFGVREPEQVSDRSNHEHLEGDRIVFAKLVMKDRKKPEKFWLPHGMPSDDRAFAFSSRVFPKASQIKASSKLWHYQFISPSMTATKPVGFHVPEKPCCTAWSPAANAATRWWSSIRVAPAIS